MFRGKYAHVIGEFFFDLLLIAADTASHGFLFGKLGSFDVRMLALQLWP